MSKLNMNQKAAFVFGDGSQLCVKFDDSDYLISYGANGKKFVADIPTIFNKVNGVLLKVFEYHPNEYATNMDFCKAAKEKLDSLQIQHHFSSNMNTIFSELLITTNTSINFHELIYFVMAAEDMVAVSVYEYTEHGYKKISFQKILAVDLKENPDRVREKIIGSSNPKKVFLVQNAAVFPLLKLLRMALKSKKLVVFDHPQDVSKYHVKELTKRIFDKSFVKYHFIPTCERSYFFCEDHGENLIMLVDLKFKEDVLPFEKEFFLTKRRNSFMSYGFYEYGKEVECTIKMEEKCHRNKITFKVDEENFIDVQCEYVTYWEIENLPAELDEKMETNIPVIAITGDLSVICVHDENGYKFLDAWNGLYGKDINIRFDKEKPTFFEDNFQIVCEKEPFILNNLIHLMSMHLDNITPLKSDYTITKDSENPVLIVFENYDGTKKVASPAFLMAMVIKEQLKAIRNECGREKSTTLGFCLLDKFDVDERKRVEDGIKEACRLLSEFRKLDCVFVNV